MVDINAHKIKIGKISELIKKYSLSNKKGSLHFYHGSSNSTRPKSKNDEVIDTSDLDEIVEVNIVEKFVWVEPKVSMEKLVAVTSKYNLMPKVVMEFPKITCGGAVNGASLESSSFRYGQLSDICDEYEIILGNGEIVSASKSQNTDLFYGISGSYGSLGVITLIKIQLSDLKKFVRLKYIPTTSFQETLQLIQENVLEKEIDYLDAIMYSKSEGVVMIGVGTNDAMMPINTYSRLTDLWFYERGKIIAHKGVAEEETIPITDYFFRYDRGGFWMGEFAFPLLGIPNNKFTRLLFNGYAKTHKLFEALQTLNVSRRYFLQDLYFPFQETLHCLEYNEKNLGIYPIWLCPIQRAASEQKLSPHYISSEMLIDVGIWGQTGQYLQDPVGVNKKFEEFTHEHNGRKMLYAHAYYSENEFWNIYDRSWYDGLRKKYHAEGVFGDVWKKTHVSGAVREQRWWGFFKFFFVNPIRRLF